MKELMKEIWDEFDRWTDKESVRNGTVYFGLFVGGMNVGRMAAGEASWFLFFLTIGCLAYPIMRIMGVDK